MAMSDTTSSPPNWAQLYHRNISVVTDQTSPNMFSTGVADSTIVTSTAASFSSQTISPKATTTTGPISSTIEGRVGKSPRRRSRASRKAPTTLLNTDTANFRAMVQQFTGIPSAPYSSNSGIQNSGPPFINFGIGINDTINFNSHVNLQPQYFNNNNNHHPRQQHQQGTMFMLDNMISSNSNNSEGFFLDGLPAGQTTTAPPRPASSNGFLF